MVVQLPARLAAPLLVITLAGCGGSSAGSSSKSSLPAVSPAAPTPTQAVAVEDVTVDGFKVKSRLGSFVLLTPEDLAFMDDKGVSCQSDTFYTSYQYLNETLTRIENGYDRNDLIVKRVYYTPDRDAFRAINSCNQLREGASGFGYVEDPTATEAAAGQNLNTMRFDIKGEAYFCGAGASSFFSFKAVGTRTYEFDLSRRDGPNDTQSGCQQSSELLAIALHDIPR